MYENRQTEYGFKMNFSGFIDDQEMEEWADEVARAHPSTPAEWHCYVDMRDLETMSETGQQRMAEIKSECHNEGLTRVAVLVESPTVRLQFEQMSDGTGGSERDRYLDAKTTDKPEQTAVQWVSDGIDQREMG
jgi:anti-anti-sigma regulatory factor